VSPADPSRHRGSAARKAARGSSNRPPVDRSGPAAGVTEADGGVSATRPARSGKGSTRRQLDPDTLAALEEERDFLLRSLDDLEREHDAGDVDDPDYAQLKDDYTARAASVIRAIDDRRELAASVGGRSSWLRTAGVLCIVGVLALGLGWFVFRDAGTRAPGEGLTGNARQDSANLVLQGQQATGQAQQALGEGDSAAAGEFFERALEAYDEALELSPGNAQALTYRGWVLHNVALASPPDERVQFDERAMEYLDQAVAADDTFADARVFRAILRTDAGDFAAAQADLDAVDPEQIPTFMTSRVDELRAEVAAGLAGTPTTAAP
jgi:tetratricopeptide (TPR) repeat protein